MFGLKVKLSDDLHDGQPVQRSLSAVYCASDIPFAMIAADGASFSTLAASSELPCRTGSSDDIRIP